ncbi:MAG: hypothetical protein FWF15_11490 [Oscillospiraceae bacterium]|nr:hypothetical protein [Oscillospiraceae bacterium]
MNEIIKNSENFVGYEYKEVLTTREMEGVYTDGYTNFGWKLDGCSPSILGLSGVVLKFKRDRKIRNKAELSRLQRQFEAGITEINNLEKSKTSSAFIVAMTVGLIGTAFLAGATFAFIYANMIPLMVVLALPGFIGWTLPYFLYKHTIAQKNKTVTPLIEQQYDAIYEICEKGHALLV